MEAAILKKKIAGTGMFRPLKKKDFMKETSRRVRKDIMDAMQALKAFKKHEKVTPV